MSKKNYNNDAVKSWLNTIDSNNFETNDVEKSCPSVVESSIIESSSPSDYSEEFESGDHMHDNQFNIHDILPQMTALTFNNVNISNSTNVYLGNIYKVSGNLNINVIQAEELLPEDDKLQSDLSQQQKLRPACLIFPRYRWLAMDPLCEYSALLEPVEIIVIGYTATTSSTIQAKNIGIIRDFQTLNVEAQGFSDIVYNFLIGCDGVIYEGRGWGVEGDHTSGYNRKSVGIAFVGNFKHNLPTQGALKAFQKLLIRGVAEGHLSKDYKILTSCQCSLNTTVDALYTEFKKWDQFWDLENHS